jgi:hypothetical protein
MNSENDPVPSDLELVGYYIIYHPYKCEMTFHQWISHRITMSKTEVQRTNKMSVTRELGILTHMPDGGAFAVRVHSVRLHTTLT